MKIKLFPIIVGVIAGISLGLCVTLVWLQSQSWYAILLAVIIGVITCLFIAEPQGMAQLLKRSFNLSVQRAIKRLGYFPGLNRESLELKAGQYQKFLSRLFLRLSLALVFVSLVSFLIVAVWYISVPTGKVNFGKDIPDFSVVEIINLCLALCFSATLALILIRAALIGNWRDKISAAKTRRIWQGKWSWEGSEELKDGPLEDYFWGKIYDYFTPFQIFIGILRSCWHVYWKIIWRLLRGAIGLIIFVPCWAVLLVIDFIILLLFLLHNEIFEAARLSAIIAVTIGIIVGTIADSFGYGLAYGLGFFAFFYAVGSYFPDDVWPLSGWFHEETKVASLRSYLFKK